MLRRHRRHYPHPHPGCGKASRLVPMALVALMLILTACASAPTRSITASPTPSLNTTPGYRLSACGSSAALPTDTGTPPSAPPGVYVGNVGYQSNEGPFGDLGQRLFALDPATGTTHWCDQFTILRQYVCNDTHCPAPPVAEVAQPLLLGQTLFACVIGSGSYLYALDAATGSPRWSRAVGCNASANFYGTSPWPHVGGLVYADGAAIDAATGKDVWVTPPYHAIVAASPSLVYAIDQHTDQTVYAYDALTGALRWQRTLAAEGGQLLAAGSGPVILWATQPIDPTPDAGSPPTYLTLHALDATTGATRWQTSILNGGPTPAVMQAGPLVYIDGPHGLLALDASTGARRWSLSMPPFFPPLTGGSALYVGGSAGVWAVDAATGHPLWHWDPHRQAEQAGPPAVVGDTLVVTLADASGSRGEEYTTLGLDMVSGAVRWQRTDIGATSPPTAG